MGKLIVICLLCFCDATLWAQVREDKESEQETYLDSIEMEAELRDVAVTAQRSLLTNGIDRISYDVENDEDSKASTVLDMLRKVPYVMVDGEDYIKVKGSSAFKVYKNGRYDLTLSKNAREILKSMPSSMIKRIEVITEPGAKEDAEGVEAILNIVFVDNNRMEGITGRLLGSINTLMHPNASAYIMTQLGKFTASFDYGYGKMSKRETETFSDAHTIYSETGHNTIAHDEYCNPGSVHFTDVNASWELDSMNLLSASIGGYFYELNFRGKQQVQMLNSNNNPLYTYTKDYWMPDYLYHSWQGSMDYEHKTRREEERLTLSYMLALTRQHTDNEEAYTKKQGTPFTYTGILYRLREHCAEHTVQFDWLRPFGHGHQAESGVKYIYRNNTSHTLQDFHGTDVLTHNSFRHCTQIGALYSDYIYHQKRWSARIGLRYEYCHIKSHSIDEAPNSFRCSLHDFVPQVSVKWQMTEHQSLKLGYTTGIQRPGIEYLNPAVTTSPLTVSRGNAHLKSSRTQNLHLIYMYMNQHLTLNIAPAYKWSSGGIGVVQTSIGDVKYQTYGNTTDHRRLQLEWYIQWKPFKKTTLVMNANIGHDRYDNPSLTLGLSKFSGFLYGYIMQEMWWKLRFTLAGYGQLGRQPSNVYGYSEPWGAGSISLQRSFLREDRLTIRLGANIPFTTYKGYTSRVVQGDYMTCLHEEMRSRSFSLSISYRFGQLKSNVRKTETSIENDDVIGGIVKKPEL